MALGKGWCIDPTKGGGAVAIELPKFVFRGYDLNDKPLSRSMADIRWSPRSWGKYAVFYFLFGQHTAKVQKSPSYNEIHPFFSFPKLEKVVRLL